MIVIKLIILGRILNFKISSVDLESIKFNFKNMLSLPIRTYRE
jgi:hypothetical protein